MTEKGLTGKDLPLVSCVMPTYNRREFIPHAIRYFLRQDYVNKELIIIDDGTDIIKDLVPDNPGIRYFRLDRKITLGAKLNMACAHAAGDIIVNWDDDDWYADWRLKYQVQNMCNSNAQVCGINKLLYFDLGSKHAYQYVYPANQRVWLLGSSLCYTKNLWSRNRFADIDVGMDGLFVWNTPPDRVMVLPDHSFSVHMIHRDNISPKNTAGTWWHKHPAESVRQQMGDDWQYYSNGAIHYPAVAGYKVQSPPARSTPSTIKNVYACLVHEKEDCIIDLVRNLHYHDPASTILLYNGGNNSGLIPRNFPFSKYNAVVHNSPAPVQHGYLHSFALNCMQFALDNLDMDALTIVDSDQLCVRSGYPEYIAAFLAGNAAGMLSSDPRHVTRDSRTNFVALQAFKEYDLWKPLLQQFSNAESCFVHWTFWPSTVFTAGAARDLLKLFRENEQLRHIMRHSRIWASEEVILPTLVRLLGYEIKKNPCSYEFVRYRQAVRADEAVQAFSRPDIYWLHPVTRNVDDPLRRQVRSKFSEYVEQDVQPVVEEIVMPPAFPVDALVARTRAIQGWLSDAEARLLAACAVQGLNNLSGPHQLVEVGSYHGKSTVLLGSVVKELFPCAKLVSIDPHDGKLGAVDQGLKKFPPSFTYLKKNIEDAGLSAHVEMIQAHSYEVGWDSPVSFLLIDGLHDYGNVSRDFQHFSEWVRSGAYIAFHDYIHYYPGVQRFVNELLAGGAYRKVRQAESLIVIQKL